jgi:hypothetical protein
VTEDHVPDRVDVDSGPQLRSKLTRAAIDEVLRAGCGASCVALEPAPTATWADLRPPSTIPIERLARTALAEGVSFIVQGAGIRGGDSLLPGPLPPRSTAWFFGEDGYEGRKKACVECLGAGLCKCRESDLRESFCITDALLRAAILGDTVRGLFYTGQSVTRIPERTVRELKTVQEIVLDLDRMLEDGSHPTLELSSASASP